MSRFINPITLLALFGCMMFMYPHGVLADVSVAISPNGSTINATAGSTGTVGFGATVSGAPSVGQECTLSGPTYSWSGGDSNSSLSSAGSGATITFCYQDAGDYTISVGCSASYSATSQDGKTNCGGPWSGSGSATVTIHVTCPG